MDPEPLLDIRNLSVSFRTDAGTAVALDDVSFRVPRGKTVALVGESGCGKSVTALSILQLLPESNSDIERGEIRLDGEDLLRLGGSEIRRVRGNRISMIFQEPMTALNPVFTIGSQIAEVFRIHRGASRSESCAASVEMLRRVGIPDPERRMGEYPFQMSGGMRQRAMIAMALACEPQLLIADEPTTALDVTIQAQILALMRSLQEKNQASILLITHDLGVVAEVADDVVIMYAGRIAERGSVEKIFGSPEHPYTRGLLDSIPALDAHRDRPLETIQGTVPGLRDMPEGCRFHPRCAHAADACRKRRPPVIEYAGHHAVACHWVAGEVTS